MPIASVFDMTGAKTGEMELNAAVFGIEPNEVVLHAAVKNYLANQRQGTQSTLTRTEVRGGGIKPWRQKGTGRARQGSIRSPQWAGGGTVFGPHPRSYAFRVNNKEVKLAMRSALSAKVADGQFTVVDEFKFEKPCTKDAKAFIKAMGFEGQRTTLVIGNDDVTTWLSFRNLEKVNILPVAEANTYELLDNKQLVFTAEALKRIEEVLA